MMVGAKRGYVVCSNPRSGSTYFLYLLRSTGVLGRPSEWIRGDGGPANDEFPEYTTLPDKQILHVLDDGATPNGIYGLKMFPEHFDSTAACRWAEELPNLSYISLVREDVLGQAVSLAIARQTNSYAYWHAETREPVFDRGQIARCLDFILSGEARWRAFFAVNGLQPLVLSYEGLAERPHEAVTAVAALLGVERAEIDWGTVLTRTQRTERNDLWKARFMSEAYDLSRLPLLDARLAALDTLL